MGRPLLSPRDRPSPSRRGPDASLAKTRHQSPSPVARAHRRDARGKRHLSSVRRKVMSRKKYVVTLTPDEREHLLQFVSTGKVAARALTHAHILLKAD